MADNFTKLWFQKDQNAAAINRAKQAISLTGKALPCRVVSVSGSIVTVAFEVNTAPWTIPQIAIPKAESNWIRMPTQVGDFGMVVPSDVYLGGVSGLGGGVATMARAGGLGALLFVPVSNKNSPPDNPNAAQVMGPQGAIIRTEDGNASIVVSGSGITLNFGGKTVVLNSAGFTIDGILFDTHIHNVVGVQPGSATIPSQGPQG
jgi:hypothetical protein